jgi:aminoglycoside phosphotransferase family enzyme/predicted kinase
MDLAEVIEALQRPEAYPAPPRSVEVRHTHISVVFLAGPHVYKVKKPLALGYLDFSTLDKRHRACLDEVRLNARLAPHVYLGVVPIVRTDAGLRVEADGRGEVVEWAVKMVRLPDDATLAQRLAQGRVDPPLVAALARTIAAFHARAERSERIAQFGRFEIVAANARDNFTQTLDQVSRAVSPAVFARVRELTEQALADQRTLINERAAAGMPCDTHGDLRLDHVYWLDRPGSEPQTVIIDCVEFNEQFRYSDPIADMAFLAMGLKSAGAAELARAFVEAYFDASGDAQGRKLLPFYMAYRAVVRAKVDGLKALEAEVPTPDREEALLRARRYWLVALGELEPPSRRPALVLVGGLPGTGKSTLADELARREGFELIRSDVVRKQLAGLASDAPQAAPFGQGLYAPEWTERTYEECLRRAEGLVHQGRRVIVDASFRCARHRQMFITAAARQGVPCVLLICNTPPDEVRRRLAARRGDPSDADWAIYLQAAQAW